MSFWPIGKGTKAILCATHYNYSVIILAVFSFLLRVNRSTVDGISSELSQNINLYTFSVLNLMIVVFALLRTLAFFNLAMRSSRNLHNAMFHGVLHTVMYFFHINSVGRILNRFSNDLSQVDEILPGVLMDVIQISLAILGVIIVLSIVNPWHLITISPLIVIIYYLRLFYLKTSQSVNQLQVRSKCRRKSLCRSL